MKVTREQEVFKPITLTIETKAEADYFWYLLNTNDPFQGYAYRTEVEELYVDSLKLFNEYNEAYDARGGLK